MPCGLGRYSSETFVWTVVNGIAFYKAIKLDIMQSYVHGTVLWYKEVI